MGNSKTVSIELTRQQALDARNGVGKLEERMFKYFCEIRKLHGREHPDVIETKERIEEIKALYGILQKAVASAPLED